MITGTKIRCRVVDENGVSITSENLCLPSVPEARPHKGEFIWTKDGTIRYLVVSGDWCRLCEEEEIYGFKLTLREVDVNSEKEEPK